MFSFNSSNSELRIPSTQMPNNPLSANLKNWSNTPKQFVGCGFMTKTEKIAQKLL